MYFRREGLTRLIYRSEDVERASIRKECAAREAVARGLKEYLEQLKHEGKGGRVLEFRQVVDTYGDLFTPGDKFPAANIHGGVGDAEYDSAKTSGGSEVSVASDCEDTQAGQRLEAERDRVGDSPPPGQKFVYFAPSTFEVTLQVEVWCSDDPQRKMIDLMLEDDFNPTPDWLGGGFRLELPHYCNARADYHLAGSAIRSEGSDARQGKFKAVYTILASLDLRVARARAKMLARIKSDAAPNLPIPS